MTQSDYSLFYHIQSYATTYILFYHNYYIIQNLFPYLLLYHYTVSSVRSYHMPSYPITILWRTILSCPHSIVSYPSLLHAILLQPVILHPISSCFITLIHNTTSHPVLSCPVLSCHFRTSSCPTLFIRCCPIQFLHRSLFRTVCLNLSDQSF